MPNSKYVGTIFDSYSNNLGVHKYVDKNGKIELRVIDIREGERAKDALYRMFFEDKESCSAFIDACVDDETVIYNKYHAVLDLIQAIRRRVDPYYSPFEED